MSATAEIRQELAGAPVHDDAAAAAELGALLRAGGTLRIGGERREVELVAATGAVVRRAHALVDRLGIEPTLWVRDATNLQRRTYGLVAPLTGEVADVLLDADGRPRRRASAADLAQPVAVLRGALLGAGSVSAPRRPPHLELVGAHPGTVEQLAELVAGVVGVRPSTSATRSGHRAVLKHGGAIAELLAALGATSAFLARDEQRLRRELRGEAQRLANADAANVRRAVDAAAGQVAAVELAVERVGWAGLGEDLRDVALARLANPEASLAELGALCDPPVSKSAVHRRLARLQELARDEAAGDDRTDADDA